MAPLLAPPFVLDACEPLPESPKGGGTVELLAEWRDSALCGRVRGGGVEGDAEATGEGRSQDGELEPVRRVLRCVSGDFLYHSY